MKSFAGQFIFRLAIFAVIVIAIWYLASQPKPEDTTPKAIDSLQLVSTIPVLNSSLVTYTIAVRNVSALDIKDVEFEFVYYGESGTRVGSSRETSYKIFPANSERVIEIKELAHSQTDRVQTTIIDAEWAN